MSTQPDWSRIDTHGPPDDVETPQSVLFEESESLIPDPALEDDSVQDVKP